MPDTLSYDENRTFRKGNTMRAFFCSWVAASLLMLPPLVIAQAKKSTNQNQLIRYKIEAFNAGNEAPVNYQKEIDICNEGLKEFSGDPDLRELLAEGFVGIGNYKRAEALFRELITSKNPEDRATRFWVLGAYQRMLLKQNRTRDAEDVGQELTALKR